MIVMKKGWIKNLFLFSAVLAMVFLVGFKLGESSAKQNWEGGRRGEVRGGEGGLDLSLMWRVKDKLTEKYLDREEMDDEEMVYGSIRGMVAALGDPYTVFLAPEENKIAEENLAGEFGGVGISLGYKDRTLAVMAPLADTPADKVGLMAGDLIVRIIDEAEGVDKDTVGISLGEAVQLIRGRIGSEVTLKIFREGEMAPFDVVLKRDNIVVASIELEWLDKPEGEVAWVKLYKFSDRLYEEWSEVVEEIRLKNNVAGVVLDLRNNPGGFLQASVVVASDFLSSGMVVKQESSDGRTEVYRVDKSKGRLVDEKLVVLINGGSASASEILAGALRDHGRAKLVGVTSFGKGTVQQPEEFSDGSGLHVTIARWLLPSGEDVCDEGVEPDVEVEYDAETEMDEQLEKAVEVLLE